MNQRKRQCCFCESPANSKEHYYSKWLKAMIFKLDPNLSNTMTRHLVWEKDDAPRKGRHFNQGHPVSRSVRSVCRKCNEGWMSKLQEKAKEVILPLALGHWLPMTEDQYHLIATWLTMFSFSVDQVEESTSVAPIQDRYKFRENVAPLKNWEIRIATIDSPIMAVWFDHFTLASARWIDFPENHVTFARLGKLFVFISNMEKPGGVMTNFNEFFLGLDEVGLVPIWPVVGLSPSISGVIKEEQISALIEQFVSVGQAGRRYVIADREL